MSSQTWDSNESVAATLASASTSGGFVNGILLPGGVILFKTATGFSWTAHSNICAVTWKRELDCGERKLGEQCQQGHSLISLPAELKTPTDISQGSGSVLLEKRANRTLIRGFIVDCTNDGLTEACDTAETMHGSEVDSEDRVDGCSMEGLESELKHVGSRLILADVKEWLVRQGD